MKFEWKRLLNIYIYVGETKIKSQIGNLYKFFLINNNNYLKFNNYF